MFNNKSIFITGGTGSFGKAFIKIILKEYNPKKIIVYSRDELKQYEMQNNDDFREFSLGKKNIIRYFIGDIRDHNRLDTALKGDIDFLLHAAALKQVPTAEYNPFEAVKTNIIGSQNVIDAALKNNVKKIIAISTDKAASPVNLYGATKLTADKLFIAGNNYKGLSKSIFSVVRYGNVLGSRGSVIPYFLSLKKTNSIPITDKRMTRFSITLDEGVRFVIKSFYLMKGAEIFVPKIPSYNIVDVANAILPNPNLIYSGIRPGEKIHEQMISSSDSFNTLEFNDFFIINSDSQYFKNSKNYIYKKKKLKFKQCKDGFEYSSDKNDDFLSISDIKKLIKDNIKLKQNHNE